VTTLTAYIQRNTTYALQQVQTATAPLTTHQQTIALQALDIALPQPQAWFQARDLLLALAPHLERLGLWGKSMALLQQGIRQSHLHNDTFGQMYLHHHLGLLLQRMGHYDEALVHHKTALQLARAHHDNHLHLLSLNRSAYCLRFLHRWDEARTCLTQAQTHLSPDDDEERGYINLVRGAIAMDFRKWETAREHFQQSLLDWRTSHETYLRAKALTNLGLAEQRLLLRHQAVDHYLDAINLLQQLHAPQALAVAQVNLGGLLSEVGRAAEALDYLRKAETHFRRLQDTYWQAMAHTNQARAYYHLEAWEQASAVAQRSAQLFAHLGQLYRQLNAQVVQAGALAHLGQQVRAQELIDSGLSALTQLDSPNARRFIRDAFQYVSGLLENAPASRH
jgi:tetratricopeptide (TPR) repeat protein